MVTQWPLTWATGQIFGAFSTIFGMFYTMIRAGHLATVPGAGSAKHRSKAAPPGLPGLKPAECHRRECIVVRLGRRPTGPLRPCGRTQGAGRLAALPLLLQGARVCWGFGILGTQVPGIPQVPGKQPESRIERYHMQGFTLFLARPPSKQNRLPGAVKSTPPGPR
jgi:hypothetical protein